MALSTGDKLGPYEISGPLGAGGMGEVYKARDTALNRDVAIKVLPDSFATDPDRLARFQREAQALAALNHPNIAQVYGLEKTGEVPAMVMELVEGPTLADLIASGQPEVESVSSRLRDSDSAAGRGGGAPRSLRLDQALPIARQIADALEAAHDAGIVHRDLKPANVKVTDDGTVKVLDFGLAKALGPEQASGSPNDQANSPTLTARATQMGMILGTAAYMAPEQARGKPVDKRADIWAFGVVLYEMVTGRRLFGGEDLTETLASVVKEQPDLSRAPREIRRLLDKCLQKNPKQRLRDIGDAWDLLDAGPSTGGDAPSPPRASSRLPWAIAAVATLAFVAAMFLQTAPPAESLVFPITAPPGTRLHQVVISPDGRSLAFAAESASGVSHLWLRRLDGRDIERLDGTDGAREPFWSPDSRFIGYFTESQLWKIDAATGVAESLGTTSNDRGGAWNRDGTIVFGGNDLQRIPAAGGSSAAALALDLASGENAIRYPSFLPGGDQVLFYSRNAQDPARAGLWVASLATQVRTHLTASASSSAVYVESGYLLYRRDRYLVAHPFDAGRLEFTGEPQPVAEDLWYEPGITASTSISASTSGTVAFRTGGPETTDLAWFDRSGRRVGTVWEPKSFVTVALSPDGTQVLTGFPGQGIDRRVWLYDIPSGTSRQLTTTGDNAGNHVFSGDGTRALLGIYASSRMAMWLTRLGSGAAPEPLPFDRDGVATEWRGSQVVFEVFTEDSPGRSLYLFDIETGTDRPLVETDDNEGFGTISPDGRWLAYASDATGEWEIYVETFPEAGGRWRVTTDGGHQPRWNPSGSELLYIAPDRRLMSVPVRGGSETFQWDTPSDLFQTDIVDLGPYRGSWAYAVAPDGDRFLILTRRPQGASPAVAILNWREGTVALR